MSDTPETDHLENNLSNAAHPALLCLSRKLERERDMYFDQVTYLLTRLSETQEKLFSAERGSEGSNKRLFTSPFTDPQLPVVNSFSGDAMKIIAHKKHE